MPETLEGLVVDGKILKVPQAGNIHDAVNNILRTDAFSKTVTSPEERDKINGYGLVQGPSPDYRSFGFHINGELFGEGALSYGDRNRGTAKHMEGFFEGSVLRRGKRIYGHGASKEGDFYPGTDFLHGTGKYIVTKGSVSEGFVTDSVSEGEFYRDELVNGAITKGETGDVQIVKEDIRNFILRRAFIVLDTLEFLQQDLGIISQDIGDLRGKFANFTETMSGQDEVIDEQTRIELRKLVIQIQNMIYQSSVLLEKNGLATKPLWQENMPRAKSTLIDFATKLSQAKMEEDGK